MAHAPASSKASRLQDRLATVKETGDYVTPRSATTRALRRRILSFGARLEPRYIFAAGQLV